jgi:hypothetical protein
MPLDNVLDDTRDFEKELCNNKWEKMEYEIK